MPTTIHFKTGRSYSAHGQRITATLHDDGAVTFWDHDRHCYGEFQLPSQCHFDRAVVMSHYDAGAIKTTKRAWENGMQTDGPNAKWEA